MHNYFLNSEKLVPSGSRTHTHIHVYVIIRGLVENITDVHLEFCASRVALLDLVILPGKPKLYLSPLSALLLLHPSLFERSYWCQGHRQFSRTCPEDATWVNFPAFHTWISGDVYFWVFIRCCCVNTGLDYLVNLDREWIDEVIWDSIRVASRVNTHGDKFTLKEKYLHIYIFPPVVIIYCIDHHTNLVTHMSEVRKAYIY